MKHLSIDELISINGGMHANIVNIIKIWIRVLRNKYSFKRLPLR